MAKKYRYRGQIGVTRISLKEITKHLHKIGKPILVRGYWYKPGERYQRAAVLVRGENGSIRLGGLAWGYGGEGPRGLEQVLNQLGVPACQVAKVLKTPWEEKIGEHWRVKLAA